MNAYLPQDLETPGQVGAILLAILLLGMLIIHMRTAAIARCLAWLLVVSSVIAVERICTDEPAGFRMLLIIGALLWSMKAVVTVESQAAGQERLTLLHWLGFAVLWFGMRPNLFAAAGGPARPDAVRLILMGVRRLAAGAVLVVVARLVWLLAAPWISELGARIVATALLMVGLSLLLHFGIFNVLAGLWRLDGVDCRPLFRAPLLSRSLTEFWGRRWNLAFSEMTAIGVYRPVTAAAGKMVGTVAAFLGSGILHELAISVPVKAGFGLPLAYFALHGVLVLTERRLERWGRPVETWGWPGRIWTLTWIALPLPILFHVPFLQGVVWPLIGMEMQPE